MSKSDAPQILANDVTDQWIQAGTQVDYSAVNSKECLNVYMVQKY